MVVIAGILGICLLVATSGRAEAKSGTIAGILRDRATDMDPSIASMVGNALEAEGMKVRYLGWKELTDELVTGSFDLLILAGGKAFPAGAAGAIKGFLAGGGRLIVLGGPPFSLPLFHLDGEWLSRSEVETVLSRKKPANLLFDFENPAEVCTWQRGTNNPAAGSRLRVDDYGSGQGKSLLVDILDLSGWDTFICKTGYIPEEHDLLCFWAKGDEHTPQMAVEVRETDGSRWIATVDITTEWEFYALRPDDFQYWHDNPSQGRGGPDDRVNLAGADALSFGLAFTHTAVGGGRHRFWIDQVSTESDPLPEMEGSEELVLDGLSPAYKMYPVTNASRLQSVPGQVLLEQRDFPVPDRVFSTSPRPQGTGFLKERRQRFIPLINVYDSKGNRAGYAAWMVLNGGYTERGPYDGSVWVCFGVNDPGFYEHPAVLDAITDVACWITRDAFLYEGGARCFACFHDTDSIKLGATVMRSLNKDDTRLCVRATVKDKRGRVVFQDEGDPGAGFRFTSPGRPLYEIVSFTWEPVDLGDSPYHVKTELLAEGKVIDVLCHDLNVWEPKPVAERTYIKVRDGDFYLGGKRWIAHGVNYMPSSGIGTEDQDYFEYWLSARSYDPAVIEEDLSRIEQVGMNMVSVFIYHRDVEAMNLLDLLIRAENHNLKVNLSLRPGADPLFFSESQVSDIIETYRLPENDTVFAYDLAWERSWGTYEPCYSNVKGRKGYDRQWNKWIIERYGSIGNAEYDWNYPCSRANGRITGPSDTQLRKNGPWKRMVAAYRRFVDDYVGKQHLIAAQKIRDMDPNHLVSFRMGGDTGDPTADPARFGYDFRGLAYSMDIMQPEGYGRIGDWEAVRPGVFTAVYSRYAAPGRPLLWAEFGRHVWAGSNFPEKNPLLETQAEFYEDFYRMSAISHADGTVCWWFPGGYRVNENSDYGILNPDGSDRPVTEVIRRWAGRISEGNPEPPVDYWITVDRDEDVRGIYGIYEKVKDEFWGAIAAGRFPGLRSEGMGTTSLDTPFVAVGNTSYNGNNPPKYLNGCFKKMEIRDKDGRWMEVVDGETINVERNEPVYCRALAVNTQVATWVAPQQPYQKGMVYLGTTDASDIQVMAGIRSDTPYLADAVVDEFQLTAGINTEAKVVFQMTARDRMWFGEKLSFNLVAW